MAAGMDRSHRLDHVEQRKYTGSSLRPRVAFVGGAAVPGSHDVQGLAQDEERTPVGQLVENAVPPVEVVRVLVADGDEPALSREDFLVFFEKALMAGALEKAVGAEAPAMIVPGPKMLGRTEDLGMKAQRRRERRRS